MLSEAWNVATEQLSEDWPSTVVHQIQGARIVLSGSYNQKDWGVLREWISLGASTWHSRADSTSTAAIPPVAEAAVSSTALSDAANSTTGTATVSVNAATTPSGVRTTDPSQALYRTSRRQLMPPQPCALRALQHMLPAASASADTATLPPGFSAANFPTGTTVGSAGGPFNRCCLGPNKCSCHSHKCHHCSPSSKCCPSCPSCQRCSLFKRPQCRWLHSRDIESHYA